MTFVSNKIIAFSFLHQNQLDFPNASFPSSLAFKQAIDTQAQQGQTAINGLIDNLISTTPGDSGSENLGSAPVSGLVGSNVYAQLASASSQLQGIMLTPTSAFMQRQSVMNGNMEVSQRGTTFTIPTATSQYTVDRMKSINNGSGVNANASQVVVADLNNSTLGLQVVHASLPTTGGQLMHVHTLEARDSYKLAGQTRTVSVMVKGVLAMNQATLVARYRTTEGAITPSSNLISSTSAVVINNSTWTQISLTYTVPNRGTITTSGCIGFQIIFSKTSAEASGDGAIIAQWSDNLGSSPLPYSPKPFGVEYSDCLRFYEKSYGYAVVPGSVAVSGSIMYQTRTAVNASTSGALQYSVTFKENKRAQPTMTIYSPDTGTANAVNNASTGLDRTGVTTSANNEKGGGRLNVDNTSANAIALDAIIRFHFVADSEL